MDVVFGASVEDPMGFRNGAARERISLLSLAAMENLAATKELFLSLSLSLSLRKRTFNHCVARRRGTIPRMLPWWISQL